MKTLHLVFSSSPYSTIAVLLALCFVGGLLIGYITCYLSTFSDGQRYQAVGSKECIIEKHKDWEYIRFLLKVLFAICLLISGIDVNNILVYIFRLFL